MSIPFRESGQCLNDESFGPTVHGCRANFDFTLAFEQIIFTIVPSCLFLTFGVWRASWLARQPNLIAGRGFQIAKQVVIAALAILKLTVLILVSINSIKSRHLSIAANALAFLAALLYAVLSWLEHAKSLRPSIFLNSYLLLTLILDIAKARTFLLHSSQSMIGRVFAASVCTQTLVLVFESVSKRPWLLPKNRYRSLEEQTGPIGLGLFSWLNPLFLRGGRSILKGEELPSIPQKITASQIEERFWNIFHHKTSPGKWRLAIAMAKALKWNLLLPVVPRLAKIAFTFSQPFLIQGLQSYLLLPASSANKNVGYGWIGATIFIYIGIAITSSLFMYLHMRACVIMRGYLVSSIFRQTLSLKTSSAATITLMSSDVERIRMSSYALHDYWGNTIELALAAWLLQRQLGLAFLVPVGMVVIGFAWALTMGTFARPRQAVWMKATQERVRSTANVISGLKLLKMLGIGPQVLASIEELRSKEMEASRSFRTVLVIAASNSFTFTYFMPVLAFAASLHKLTASNIFVSLSYIILFATPLVMMFQSIPQLMAALACLERIATFLERDVRVDHRTFGLPESAVLRHSHEDEKDPRVATAWKSPNGSSIKEKKESAENNKAAVAITVKGGCFGWAEDKLSLQSLDITIPRAGLTIVIGPVGSGKSTMCSALLGEVPYTKGDIIFSQPASRIAFCSQTPFLPNVTLRDAIIGYSDVDEDFYRAVLVACALEPDLNQLTNGDGSVIGSNGGALSGGQKIRVALARALYARANVVVLDDILSGLDRATGEKIFTNLFGHDGLLRSQRATVIICTHDLRFLRSANHIIALDATGHLLKQGAPVDILDENEIYVAALEKSSSNDAEIPGPQKPPQKPPVPASDTDDRSRQLGDFTIYKYYFSMFSTSSLVFAGALVLATGFLHSFSTIILKFWSDSLLGIGGKHQHGRGFYLGIYAFDQCLAFFLLFTYIKITITNMAINSSYVLHTIALRTLMNAPLSFITSTDFGKTLNRFSQDLTVVDMELANTVVNLCYMSVLVVGQAAVIATSSPYVAVGYPLLLAVLYGIQWFYLRTSRQLRFLDLEMKSPLYTQFLDAAAGLTTIRAFGWTSKFLTTSYTLLDSSQRPVYLLAMIQQWLTTVLNLTVAAIATLLVALATQLRSSAGFTSVGLISLMAFGASLMQIVQFWTQVETSIGAVSRLRKFNEDVRSEDEDEDGQDPTPVGDWPSGGAIELKNVSATYGETQDDSGDEKGDDTIQYALKDVSISIGAREKVAISGRTGSGKSSIISLLLRLLDPIASPQTSIIIDNVHLSRIPRSILRERVVCISQDAYFFTDGVSVKENLDPYDATSNSDREDVLKLVGLENVLSGLDSPMKADSLSHGQKQLFSLARAVLRRRCRSSSRKISEKGHEGGILLLDEFTASVDRDTEKFMLDIVENEFKDWTVVSIVHRLEGLDKFDRVVVMEEGRVKRIGKPGEVFGVSTH